MTLLSDVSEAVADGIFSVSFLLAVTYTLWHCWWLTSFGRSMFGLIIAPIGSQLGPVLRQLTGRESETAIAWTGTISRAAAMAGFTYLLVETIRANVRRRRPGTCADSAVTYVRLTPGLSDTEVKELTGSLQEILDRRAI